MRQRVSVIIFHFTGISNRKRPLSLVDCSSRSTIDPVTMETKPFPSHIPIIYWRFSGPFPLFPLLGLSAFTVHHMLKVQCSYSSKPKQKPTHKIVLPSQMTLSLPSFHLVPCLSFDGLDFLWQSNSEAAICFVWHKGPLPLPKNSPKGWRRALLLGNCIADSFFACYVMQLNVFWGTGGEATGAVRISTHGKQMTICALTVMISISAVSMPYSLLCSLQSERACFAA